ncbi:MAG: hypothetical protein Unbinned7865contig1001_18 [Prokaryotic dsDNA virus sp.]|nr:MAG: hypothetical protein Unbinned7865contig1001_18 [Prokaryotic dsDNA virus sp.]
MKPVADRLGQQKALENAALVAFELEKIGPRMIFGWAMMDQTDDGKAIKQGWADDWVDVLGEFPIAEVKRAIGDCIAANPKQAPNEHAVKAAINAHRAKAIQKAPKPTPQPELVSTDTSEEARAERAERAARIMEEVMAGYREKE